MQDFDTLYGWINSDAFRSSLNASMEDALKDNNFTPDDIIKAGDLPKLFEDAIVPVMQDLIAKIYG